MHVTRTRRDPLPRRMTVPGLLLRLEGLALFVAVVAIYGYAGYHWALFVVLFLTPDLSALGYLANARTGSITYNLIHTTILPTILGLIGLLAGAVLGIQLALIWLAHIGMDRTLGYGLKYGDASRHTHLDEV